MLPDALSLINRQKAEIEKKDKDIMELMAINKSRKEDIEMLIKENSQFADIGKMYSEIKAEAIKDFAERVKEEIEDALKSNYKAKTEHIEKHYQCISCDLLATIRGKIDALRGIDDFIDNLLKEMVGE
jgi:uncharacterized protein YjgD (DUF1641 family)